MGHLEGLEEYLEECYGNSSFIEALASNEIWELHVHPGRILRAKVLENPTYDVKLQIEGEGEELIPKVHVKFLYPAEHSQAVTSLLKTDKKVRALELEPIPSPHKRYHIKNKSLFPLMKERRAVFFTLLEGEILKGIVAGFSRYEILVNLKGGVPVTLLRHGIYDLRDKKGRCFMKSFQETRRDWEKSDLYVSP